MTDEQKRFKIQKIYNYEEQVSYENKESIKKTFLLGIAAVAVWSTLAFPETDTNSINKIVSDFVAIAGPGFGVYYLKGLIESICRKTNLESKIEDLRSELQMPESQESRGIRR